ncbi:inositol monophosphatase family protein [Luedemannella helvata]|uniref:inositol-phosphate phosphatase n=1 Tax=Luedemannella helvata TaxID=349315 RepID=A0ABP4WZA9_9ACTN
METIDTDAGRLAGVAAQAATLVGPALAEAFQTRPKVAFKRDRHDPVTVHDRAAEASIRDFIMSTEPDSTVVGEEDGVRGSGRVHWYVDPIDGTANFARGLPFWCTSVAAVVDGAVVAGAIYDPVRGDLFTASTTGAWCNEQPMHSTGVTEETAAMLVTSYPGSRGIETDRERVLARTAQLITTYATVRRPGSTALNLAYVASGRVDVALGIGINAWDVAAGALMVRQAGGHYFGLRRGEPNLNGPDPAWTFPGYLAMVGTLDPAETTVRSLFADSYQVNGL